MADHAKQLTDQQVAFFKAFGFVAYRQCFAGRELEAIGRDFEMVMAEARGGKSFDGRDRQQVSDMIQHQPAITQILADERIGGSVRRLLGPGCYLQSTDANLYVGDTLWHADHGWHPTMLGVEPTEQFRRSRYHPGLKVSLYLDQVGPQSGCLRVIPGSQISPFHESLRSLHCDIGPEALAAANEPEFGVKPAQIPCYSIESRPGDVVFFSHLVWHSSFGGRSGRRMFSMNFAAETEAEADA